MTTKNDIRLDFSKYAGTYSLKEAEAILAKMKQEIFEAENQKMEVKQISIDFSEPNLGKDYCSCCSQKIKKLNPHRMDAGKIRVLQWIAKINTNYPWVKIQQDVHLIPEKEKAFTIQTDAVHASRLAWFNLIERLSERSGLYRITDNGIEFLKGKLKVPSLIYCRSGKVIKISEDYVTINDVKNVILDKEYWDNYSKYQINE